ncbi:ATP-binding protein [Ruegeria sp. HKCCC2117]|uniref:ATP-binding protein n=1 Tax=Ruegeria sp. HKCCC2117 TaxID=2682992 RepID=UPI00148813A0|nr:ATP-binding protein [Ruegeria sp. HKCCC2117]
MKIKRVILENFRSYQNRTTIEIDNLTCIIGKNDAGKSTLLEALDIFFEGGVVKLEPTDASVGGDPRNVRIGVVFSDLPAELVLDSNALTTLEAEHLLNGDGELEIHKVFNCTLQTPKAEVFANAVYPTANGANEILLKSQADLRKIIRDRGLVDRCNQAENPSMRNAIYRSFDALEAVLQYVPLSKDNGKTVFKSLQGYMPLFALFQSDRPSKDQDPEVQNPMKLAVEQALDGLENDLNTILDTIHQRARETANRTLEKLGENYPEIATTLEPKFKKPAWKNIFKMDLEGDEGIPINKRGSGVRRLILLSFFQAEAEKKRLNDVDNNARPIFYAIEEPETSQHPDNQLKILSAMSELASSGDQVLLTTHVPALAGKVPLECLRFIDSNQDNGHVRIRSGQEDPNVFDEIASTLGVYPDAIDNAEVKVAVLVEGKTDIDAIQSMISVLTDADKIEEIDDAKIFWTIGGGDTTLRDWVERRYLDRLRIPQVIIQDSDRTSHELPVPQRKAEWLREMEEHGHISAFLTQKRCMDNYVHPDAISRLTGGIVELPADTDLDFQNLASTLSPLLTQARGNARQTGFDFRPTEHNGNPISGTNTTACKRIICAHVLRNMTAGELLDRSKYMRDGQEHDEIQEWIGAIRQHL